MQDLGGWVEGEHNMHVHAQHACAVHPLPDAHASLISFSSNLPKRPLCRKGNEMQLQGLIMRLPDLAVAEGLADSADTILSALKVVAPYL